MWFSVMAFSYHLSAAPAGQNHWHLPACSLQFVATSAQRQTSRAMRSMTLDPSDIQASVDAITHVVYHAESSDAGSGG
jgi:hypothetical protein